MSSKRIEFRCAICRKIAGSFGYVNPFYTFGTKTDARVFTYDGICFSTRDGPETKWTDEVVDPKHVEKIQKLAPIPRKLHEFLTTIRRFRGGLDCYCTECDAVYCRDHYKRTAEWSDDDTLDAINGVCPKGHERALHVVD